ncbi:hypothetical protein WDV91_07825 [Curtobacterium flaccumfaciens pv. flaccumfaciens]
MVPQQRDEADSLGISRQHSSTGRPEEFGPAGARRSAPDDTLSSGDERCEARGIEPVRRVQQGGQETVINQRRPVEASGSHGIEQDRGGRHPFPEEPFGL